MQISGAKHCCVKKQFENNVMTIVTGKEHIQFFLTDTYDI